MSGWDNSWDTSWTGVSFEEDFSDDYEPYLGSTPDTLDKPDMPMPGEDPSHPGPAPEFPKWTYVTIWTESGPQIWKVPADDDGNAIVMPGEYTEEMAAQGIPEPTLYKSYEEQWEGIQGLPEMFDWNKEEEGMQVGFNDWAESQGIQINEVDQYLSEIDQIIDALDNGTVDEQAAAQYKARQLGFTSVEEMEQAHNSLTELLYTEGSTVQDMAGLTEEELDLRERYQANAMRNMEKRERDMLDNVLAASGSKAKYLRTADEALGRMQDAELQYTFTVAQEDSERRRQEWERKNQVYTQMVQMGQMSEDQYLQNVRADRSLAIQALSNQAAIALQENQQYLNMFKADLDATNAYITAEFNQLNAELGIDAHAMDMASQAFQEMMAPYQAAMTEWQNNLALWEAEQTAQANADAIAAQNAATGVNAVTGIIGAGVGLLALFLLF